MAIITELLLLRPRLFLTMESLTINPARMSSRGAIVDALIACFVRGCGLLFIYAGLRKAVDPSELSTVFEFYRFSQAVAQTFVWVVTLGEVALGTLLLIKPMSRALMVTLVVTLIFYSANLTVLLFYERAPNCGCLMQAYSQGRHGKIIGLIRNSVLLAGIAFSIYAVRRGTNRWAPQNAEGVGDF